jgi:leucyl aminopeptidase
MENLMQFHANTGSAGSQKTTCLVLPVYSEGPLPAATRSVDAATGGLIGELLDSGDIKGAIGDTLLVRTPDAISAKRLLLIGCGKRDKFDRKAYRRATTAIFSALKKTRIKDAVSCLSLENVKGTDAYRRVLIAVESWHYQSYRFTSMKSSTPDDEPALKSFGLAVRSNHAARARQGIKHGKAISQGISLSRDLGNLPANVCTPSYLAQQARAIGKGRKNLHIEALNENAMEKLGMGSLLSVTAGTAEPAKLIVLNHSGAAASKRPVVLVGKGVTFDTGGISLKPSPAMDEMKYDMCGAATVLGVFRAVTELNLNVNLIGIIPACENMPGSTATKPGDIVTSMSGKTIEVLNTDAEGRLILCDALTYAQRFKPAALIDIATLTGACIVALGRHRSGLLSNSDTLSGALLKAGEKSDDNAWRLPIDDEYQKLLKSNFADLAKIGGRDAGTITAACFLSKFVEDSDWAHLDIAGTAWRTGPSKGSTGRPIPLLMEYLLNR